MRPPAQTETCRAGAIDRDAAKRHLLAIDPQADAFIFLATDDSRQGRAARTCVGTLADLLPGFARLQAQRYAIHVCVNEMQGQRRRITDVIRVRAIWAEMDRPATQTWPLPPSLEVQTSPGKVHVYWLTDYNDSLPPAEAADINRTIASRYGADPNACDLARVLRLAGTLHHKAAPHRVEIIGGDCQRYGRDALLQAFRPPPPPPPRQPQRCRKAITGMRPQRYVDSAVRGELQRLSAALPGQRNATLNRVSFRLGQLGLAEPRVKDLLTPIALATGLPADEIERTIARGVSAGSAKSPSANQLSQYGVNELPHGRTTRKTKGAK